MFLTIPLLKPPDTELLGIGMSIATFPVAVTLLQGGAAGKAAIKNSPTTHVHGPGESTRPFLGSLQPTRGLHCPRDSPMGPRLGPADELCGGGWPTSWLTEGSLLTPPCTLFIGERTGP